MVPGFPFLKSCFPTKNDGRQTRSLIGLTVIFLGEGVPDGSFGHTGRRKGPSVSVGPLVKAVFPIEIKVVGTY